MCIPVHVCMGVRVVVVWCLFLLWAFFMGSEGVVVALDFLRGRFGPGSLYMGSEGVVLALDLRRDFSRTLRVQSVLQAEGI